MPDIRNNGFLYNLLIQPGYRVMRHILLITALIIISLNQAFATFSECLPELGNRVYPVFLAILASYIAVGYCNIFVLVPRYMLTKKFAAYLILFMLSILFIVFIHGVIEYIVYSLPGIRQSEVSMFSSPSNFMVDNLSALCLDSICIAGVSTTVFFKQWITNNQQVAVLEKEHLQSEVEQLKDQVTPLFLFNILNRSAILATQEPVKASDMLMKLSFILRYQLYDSAREKVLLSSEINFLQNYLTLQKLYYKDFNFTIGQHGNINKILIPPLLLNPFIQCAIDNSLEKNVSPDIHLDFHTTDNLLVFQCTTVDKAIIWSPLLDNVKKRLSLLFPGKYSIEMTANSEIKLQLFF